MNLQYSKILCYSSFWAMAARFVVSLTCASCGDQRLLHISSAACTVLYARHTFS